MQNDTNASLSTPVGKMWIFISWMLDSFKSFLGIYLFWSFSDFLWTHIWNLTWSTYSTCSANLQETQYLAICLQSPVNMLFCKPCPTQWGWKLPYFLHLKLQCSNLFNQLSKKQIDLCCYSALCWQPPTKASSKKEGREQTGGGLSGWEWAPGRAFRGWPTVTSLRAVFRILFL